jgi:hypothetical protein
MWLIEITDLYLIYYRSLTLIIKQDSMWFKLSQMKAITFSPWCKKCKQTRQLRCRDFFSNDFFLKDIFSKVVLKKVAAPRMVPRLLMDKAKLGEGGRAKLGEGERAKLGEGCPKVRLSQDRMTILSFHLAYSEGKGTKLGEGGKELRGGKGLS